MSEPNNREVLVSLKNVEISFDNGGKQKFKAVQDATFDIYKGETFALVGGVYSDTLEDIFFS